MAPPPNWPISATLETRAHHPSMGVQTAKQGRISLLAWWRKINWPGCEILIAVSLLPPREWISRNVEVRGRRRIFLSASKTGWRVYPTALVRVWKITVTRKINNRPPPLEGYEGILSGRLADSDGRKHCNCKIFSLNMNVWKEVRGKEEEDLRFKWKLERINQHFN